MSKKIKGSYLLNAVGVALVFALLTGLFAANAFGTSTTYIQGICTTACYTIIMVTHNMQQAARVSDKTAFFYLGQMVEFDDTKKIFTNPEKVETQNYITGRFG